MSEQPWMKFYPRDWRGDQALRAVSLAARGLWMECLCIMHEARPYGHLLLNGQPVEDDALARMAGAPLEEVSALKSELLQAGVAGLTSKGVIFSRRMTKDRGRAQKGRKAAQKRWAQSAENTPKNGAPNRSPNRKPITQKPEARDSVPNGTGPPANLAERLWSDGLAVLLAAKVPERQARSLIGKWRKPDVLGDAGTLAGLAYCQANGVMYPLSYMEKMAQNGNGRRRETDEERQKRERQEWLDKRYPVAAQ